jgi:aminoglycoside phosphotransferase (APT) family kinase protein
VIRPRPIGPRLVGRGRWADVVDAGGRRVVRTYRDSHRDATREAELMRYLVELGLRVPAVYDAEGPSIVMERIEGPTMLDDVARRPWLLLAHARTLAGLHDAIHRAPPPSWLAPAFGGGNGIVHLDLHPGNVLMAPDGPVVIDWQSAACGPPWADFALAYVIMSTSTPSGRLWTRAVATAGQGVFASAFLGRCTPAPTRSQLATAAHERLADRGLPTAEVRRVQRLRARLARA